jgi:hypothetical protein
VDQLAVFVELGVSFVEHVVSVLSIFMLFYAALLYRFALDFKAEVAGFAACQS